MSSNRQSTGCNTASYHYHSHASLHSGCFIRNAPTGIIIAEQHPMYFVHLLVHGRRIPSQHRSGILLKRHATSSCLHMPHTYWKKQQRNKTAQPSGTYGAKKYCGSMVQLIHLSAHHKKPLKASSHVCVSR